MLNQVEKNGIIMNHIWMYVCSRQYSELVWFRLIIYSPKINKNYSCGKHFTSDSP